MDFTPRYIPYHQTGSFSKIVTDYLAGDHRLRPFFSHQPDLDGIRAAIKEKKQCPVNRELLTTELRKQYSGIQVNEKLQSHLDALGHEDTFTICTAHQPNLFTGHLYFIYKIIHAIKLADVLTTQLPDYRFVPVYYMGSEDADLEELGHVFLSGDKYNWDTAQTGAVGRMKVDASLLKLINDISGQLTIFPYGKEIIELLKRSYHEGLSMEQATFRLVHALFGDKGLVVLLPDNPELKRAFIPVTEKELQEGFSRKAVNDTIAGFPHEYKVQAGGRELNLFYLDGHHRDRITREGELFVIQHRGLQFTEKEMMEILLQHPERFSPNVILRPVFQEMILPNVAFIGGGGELAYWLELKQVFNEVKVPFPVIILRQSFQMIEKRFSGLANKLGLKAHDLFKDEFSLMNELVSRESANRLKLDEEKKSLQDIYNRMTGLAGNVNPSLAVHVKALETQSMKKIVELEKKMMRGEKRKFEDRQRQLQKLRSGLFPSGHLQERMDNILPYYALWGRSFMETLYRFTREWGDEFAILEEK